jgi:hypothetical protein
VRPAYAWGSLEILGLRGLGGFLLLLLILQELRVRDPLLPPRVFRSASYVANVIVSTFAATLTFTCVFTIPLYFQLGRGVTAAESGVCVVPFMLASAAGNIIGSRWGSRFGAMRGVLRIASFLGCAGLVLLGIDGPLRHRRPERTVQASRPWRPRYSRSDDPPTGAGPPWGHWWLSLASP